MDTPNYLDLQNAMAALYWQIHLHCEDMRATMAYDAATSFCSNCPGDYNCCKQRTGESGMTEWDEANTSDFEALDRYEAILKAIHAQVEPDVLAAARKVKP